MEDDDSHAELVRRAFERDGGAAVDVAGSLAVARLRVRDRGTRPDILVTDLRLPDGQGTELLADVVDLAPLIVMTSQGDEAAAVQAMKAGAVDYIVKTDASLLDMPRATSRALREWRQLRETERLREALVEQERLAAVGTAAAMLAHEIGNPLNAMRLHAELISRRVRKLDADTDLIQDGLDRCMSEIRRLEGLLHEFRNLSRQRELVVRVVNVAELVQRVVDTQRPAAEVAGVTMELRVDEGLSSVELDSDKLTQVLINLGKNAVEATPSGGRVRFEVRQRERELAISIEDTGTGVPPGIDIFAPFRSSKVDGSGLGLAVVKQIVVSHGGRITYESEPGMGTRFDLALPLVQRRRVARAAPSRD